jgi:hypothetical protein
METAQSVEGRSWNVTLGKSGFKVNQLPLPARTCSDRCDLPAHHYVHIGYLKKDALGSMRAIPRQQNLKADLTY